MSYLKGLYHTTLLLTSSKYQEQAEICTLIDNIADTRKAQKLSQRMLADRLQLLGLDVDKNAVQRIEAGLRFVTDIELVALSQALNLPYDILLSPPENIM